MVIIFSRSLEGQLECQNVFSSLSKIFEKTKLSKCPASLEIVASSLSPYQMLSSGEHDPVSIKGSSNDAPVSQDEHSRVRDRDPFLA